MAGSKHVVVKSAITFGGTAYDVRTLPCGVPETTDLPDVTVLSDVEQRFAPSACTEDGEISITIAGTPPAVNAVGALVITQSVSVAGGTATSETVACGQCIVTAVSPSTLEAGGDRVQTWDVTFRPNGTRS